LVTETQPGKSHSRRPIWTVMGYGLMILFTIVIFLVIRSYGETLVAPPAANAGPVVAAAQGSDIFLRILVALTAIIVTGQVLAKLFAYLGQPPVIGEVVAGILLGPSLLGPQVSALILPASIAPTLGVIAQLGVVLYMFLIGLELNPALLKHRAHATVATSHASILVPFILGTLLALPLYPRLSSNTVTFTSFALFMGVAMSITAFPVLARILTDYRLTNTRLGVVALSCAAVDDVTAWCLLAFVVGIAKAQMGAGLFVVVGALAYIAFMFLLGRPLLEWITQRWGGEQQSRALAILIFVALLLSALTAEAIGIHAIFGAFLLGAVIPHDSAAARTLTRQLESVVTILLLPAFFAFTGMRTRIDLLSEPSQWLICSLIILVAALGKFGGTLAAARLTGLGWRNAAMLGTLMNTRGLMELIVLNVGLDLRVISPTLFAMLVLMALATTALTSPVLRWLKMLPTSEKEVDMLAELQTATRGETEG
jgi:Kef-type K+ transport system membrane component KefB